MRQFPLPDKDVLIAFAYHSTRIEHIPVSMKELEDTVSGAQRNPYISGQLTAINLVIELARDPNLIPESVEYHNVFDHLSFLKRVHLNLMHPLATWGEHTDNPGFIKMQDVGNWRQDVKVILTRTMPSPFQIQQYLYEWFNDICEFHNNFRQKIETPQGLEPDDICDLIKKAYDSNLKLCCIKPFWDGSNRTARLIENLFRLNWGLPWKVIKHDEDDTKQCYAKDIIHMQRLYQPN